MRCDKKRITDRFGPCKVPTLVMTLDLKTRRMIDRLMQMFLFLRRGKKENAPPCRGLAVCETGDQPRAWWRVRGKPEKSGRAKLERVVSDFFKSNGDCDILHQIMDCRNQSRVANMSPREFGKLVATNAANGHRVRVIHLENGPKKDPKHVASCFQRTFETIQIGSEIAIVDPRMTMLGP